MPELAEVEVVRQRLCDEALRKRIKEVIINYGKTIETNQDDFKKHLFNQSFVDVKRKGKYLIFQTDDYDMVSHLRMEGRYYYKDSSDAVLKHEHVIFRFDNGKDLRYYDSRKFGRIALLPKNTYMEYPGIKKLGLDANDPSLTKEYLYEKLKNKKLAIKTSLLDQSIIAGLGNIYVNEVLFLAHIDPRISSDKITLKDCEHIIKYAKEVLDESIKFKGTTIHSFESSLGVTGGYQEKLKVHGRANEECVQCKTKILKIKVNGRGTYYCPKCQKS